VKAVELVVVLCEVIEVKYDGSALQIFQCSAEQIR
jgi:hypothetical protein